MDWEKRFFCFFSAVCEYVFLTAFESGFDGGFCPSTLLLQGDGGLSVRLFDCESGRVEKTEGKAVFVKHGIFVSLPVFGAMALLACGAESRLGRLLAGGWAIQKKGEETV